MIFRWLLAYFNVILFFVLEEAISNSKTRVTKVYYIIYCKFNFSTGTLKPLSIVSWGCNIHSTYSLYTVNIGVNVKIRFKSLDSYLNNSIMNTVDIRISHFKNNSETNNMDHEIPISWKKINSKYTNVRAKHLCSCHKTMPPIMKW